mmetsp:Transcript_13713/g.44721  ORF Transcript_13713/g.44721 Transcript_13713/m.44721 type:complete len:489 (-) Transcript_13713:48-1514(-)
MPTTFFLMWRDEARTVGMCSTDGSRDNGLRSMASSSSWTCPRCTAENDADFLACAMCGSEMASSFSSDDWPCGVCTYRNLATAAACALCEAPKKKREDGEPPAKKKAKKVQEATEEASPSVSLVSSLPPPPQKKTKKKPVVLPSLQFSKFFASPYPAGNPRRQRPWGAELPVCAVGDVEGCRRLLDEHGVVVFRSVADAASVKRAEDLFWRWLETHTSARRGDARTHLPSVFESIGYANTGVVTKFSVGQSAFLWHCRKAARPAWATVWGTTTKDDALVSSFDGCGVWRNPYLHLDEKAKAYTDGNWYHLDQNFNEDPGFKGYQGLLHVGGAGTALTGSTVVVPGSHRDFEANCTRGGKALDRGSFVRLTSKEDRAYCDVRAVQVAPLEPGDVLVWDSRVVHCSAGCAKGLPQTHPLRADDDPPPLARLVAYVAMLPRSKISSGVAEKRRAAVRKGTGSGWDARLMRNYPPPAKNYRPVTDHDASRLV